MAYDARCAELNLCVLEKISDYLLRHPRFIEAADVRELTALGVEEEQAVLLLLAAATGVEEERSETEREMLRRYYAPGLKRLDAQTYRGNAYLRAIRFPEAQRGEWRMTHMAYSPYELFVRDDLQIMPDGREIVRLGYFDEAFVYPAVLQHGREWMTVTPNEIETMAPAIRAARGHVAALGLGLGYFAFMASEKTDVDRVTVVERDPQVIELFRQHILPQFANGAKIRIVQADAYDYVCRCMDDDAVDTVFVDLWHDVSDGAQMYQRMKAMEKYAPQTVFSYWIETSIRSFLKNIGEKNV